MAESHFILEAKCVWFPSDQKKPTINFYLSTQVTDATNTVIPVGTQETNATNTDGPAGAWKNA